MVEDPRSAEDSVRSSKKKDLERYEEVVPELLRMIADRFGVTHFEGKQKIPGKLTDWRIDAKGAKDGTDIFLIVECRRYTKKRQSQGQIAELDFRIRDTGASGGIVVSPLGLQKGAKRIARAKNIHSVTLTPDSTLSDYFMEFLGDIWVGRTERLQWNDRVLWTLRDENGRIIGSGGTE